MYCVCWRQDWEEAKKRCYYAFVLSISYHLILPQALKEHILDMLSRHCRVEQLLFTELNSVPGPDRATPGYKFKETQSCLWTHCCTQGRSGGGWIGQELGRRVWMGGVHWATSAAEAGQDVGWRCDDCEHVYMGQPGQLQVCIRVVDWGRKAGEEPVTETLSLACDNNWQETWREAKWRKKNGQNMNHVGKEKWDEEDGQKQSDKSKKASYPSTEGNSCSSAVPKAHTDG